LTSAVQINAATYHFITLLGEFDENGGWHGDGIRSFSHWLNWKIGMGEMMGREKVRVARALGDLPLIDAAFSRGEISYSKVRAMTRVATPENESFLMQIAEYGTAQHMEVLVKKYALCKRLERIENSDKNDQSEEDALHEEHHEEEARYAEYKKDKTLNWFQDELGMIEIKVRLPPDEGAIVIKALEVFTRPALIIHQTAWLLWQG